MQVQAPNRPELLWSRAMVVSVEGKGAARPCQVRTMKTNASKPLMTCRKCRDDVETGESRCPGTSPEETCELTGRRPA